MEYQLPTEFDLIVVGTGMVESIISAAASRIGKTVLHIDSNSYYGGLWTSYNLDSMQKLDKANEKCLAIDNSLISEGEQAYSLGNDLFNLKDFCFKWHIPEKNEPVVDEKGKDEATSNDTKEQEKSDESKEVVFSWTQERLLQDSRKFNIDLSPKLHFARGEFVELLISSNIARYSEFKSVSRVMTWLNGQLEVVPCSRSDVFANNKVSVIEKRMLMQFLTSLDRVEKELEGSESKTFHQYLKDRKLTPNLIHYVLYSISMSCNDTPCIQGIESTKRFMNSLGRFGKTPFLFSMYGSGEVPQQFCRLSAVFGGIYALNYSLNGYIFNSENNFQSLVCAQKRVNAQNIVMGVDKAPKHLVESVEKKYISRAVFITDKSISESEKEHLTLLLYPPEGDKDIITVIELEMLTGTCPKELYLVHMITRQKTNPQDDFKLCTAKLFGLYEDQEATKDIDKPRVLCSIFFSLPDTSESDLGSNIPSNVYLCQGPDFDLDYDQAIEKAKQIFGRIYPDTEFLPRAPDPEEIIIGDEAEETPEEVEKTDHCDDSQSNFEQPKESNQQSKHEVEAATTVSGDNAEVSEKEELQTCSDVDCAQLGNIEAEE